MYGKKDYRKSNPGTHGLGFSWNVLRTCIVILLFVAGIVAATQDFAYAMNGDQRVVNTPLLNWESGGFIIRYFLSFHSLNILATRDFSRTTGTQ